jgi:hypothetical protein
MAGKSQILTEIWVSKVTKIAFPAWYGWIYGNLLAFLIPFRYHTCKFVS